ncbi:MAG TPA: DUF3619 family protein [Rubrivivax sp.]
MTIQRPINDAHGAALEARFARRVTAALDERELGHDIGQRLRVARDQALMRARHARSAVVATGVVQVSGGSVVMGGPPWWLRLASLAPLILLSAGLMLIDRLNTHEQMVAAADIDAVLLADELPPSAYSDPGFGEFLKLPTP